MNHAVHLSYLVSRKGLPASRSFQQWVAAVLAQQGVTQTCELSIRLVDEAEGKHLNQQYRGKPYATNVLSFPSDVPPSVANVLPFKPLGDLVICAPVIAREAAEQHKSTRAHHAHMTIHGVLHLLGHDHQTDADADAMERLETAIMNTLGLPNPYQIHPD